jgi:hypothetical protein
MSGIAAVEHDNICAWAAEGEKGGKLFIQHACDSSFVDVLDRVAIRRLLAIP